MADCLKYGKVLVEDGNIPSGEPVFILRAQDRLAIVALEAYASAVLTCGKEKEMHKSVKQSIVAFNKWPKKKMPD